jgi:hypothetical protein
VPRNSYPSLDKPALIEQLQHLAHYLGRIPRSTDILFLASEKKAYPLHFYIKFFGSYSNALLEAGFNKISKKKMSKPKQPKITRTELIAQLVKLSQHLQRPLIIKDIRNARKAGLCAAPYYFIKEFGSLKDAYIAAGVKSGVRSHNFWYSKNDLILQLKALAKDLGKAPSADDINRASCEGKCAGRTTFIRVFGTIKKARQAAGLGYERVKQYTRDQLIKRLRDLASELGRVPRRVDIDKDVSGKLPTSIIFDSEFGSFRTALLVAGLSAPVAKNRRFTRVQLLQQLKNMHKELGRIPMVKDIEDWSNQGKCASVQRFREEFKTVINARKEAGIEGETRGAHNRKNKKEEAITYVPVPSNKGRNDEERQQRKVIRIIRKKKLNN